MTDKRTARRQYGEGSIYPYDSRGVERYRVQWFEPVDPDYADGALRRRSKGGFSTKKEAATFLRSMLGKVDRGQRTRLPGNDLLLGAYLSDWVEGLRLEGTTTDGYRRLIRLHVKPYAIADMPLSQVRPQVLAKHYRTLEAGGRRVPGRLGEPLGPNTVRKVHDLLSSAFTSAQADGLIEVNPARQPGAKPPTQAQIEKVKPPMQIWTPEELERVLEWARANSDLYAAWIVFMSTGLRRSEVLGLRWRDVDAMHERLEVRRALIRRNEGDGASHRLEEKLTKANHSRPVDVPRQVLSALHELRVQMASRDQRLVTPEARVITRRGGGVMRPDQLGRRWVALVDRYNRDPTTISVPPLTLHGLRHSHASHLLAAGVEVNVVAERLGHGVMVLLKTYAHSLPSAQRGALAKLETYRTSRPSGGA